MDIQFQAGGPDRWSADMALIPLWQDEKILETCPELGEAAPFLQIAPGMRDLAGRRGELHTVYGHPDLPYSRVLFAGLGREPESGEIMPLLREAFARAVRRARAMKLSAVHIPWFSLERFGDPLRVLEEAVYACVLADHTQTEYKATTRDDLPVSLDRLVIGFGEAFVPDRARKAARRGESSAETVIRARDLANAPGNRLYPEIFAEKAESLASAVGLRCEVLDEKELARQGFGAHLAVGQGGAHPPRLVILEYGPADRQDAKPIVLVGKGVTFDSGGLSLKPAAGMHAMKSDMSGAAAVLSCLVTLAREECPCRVTGVIPLAENMPDGAAYRPGDVVQALSGDQVEIVNTDAEGRLLLCDALTYAQKRWSPGVLVDTATLTGACAVALGNEVAGLFSTDADLADHIVSAGHCAGEAFWRLPLWQSYAESLKSPVADICHRSSMREAGAITAALFLQHFVEKEIRWAHLDIAGVDWTDKDTPLCPKGATGFAARTLLEFCRGGMA